jgi:hypothetical protein
MVIGLKSMTDNKLKVFIWMEIFGCDQIALTAIDSFLYHHPNDTINIFGYDNDLCKINEHDRIIKHSVKNIQLINERGYQRISISNVFIKHIVNSDSIKSFIWYSLRAMRMLFVFCRNNLYFKTNSLELRLRNRFISGHKGTATLWAYIIKYVTSDYLIHIDSDVIFFDEVISEIKCKLKSFDIVGPRRVYSTNVNKLKIHSDQKDTISTYIFGFKVEYFSKYSFLELESMIQGELNILGFPVIDFFDSLTFLIYFNKGNPYYLDPNKYGSMDSFGSRNNLYPILNNIFDFGSKIMHFSSVCSGYNIHNNISTRVTTSYAAHSLYTYKLYQQLILKIKDEDVTQDEHIKTILNYLKINRENWSFQIYE